MCTRCTKLEFIQLSTGGFVSVFVCRMLMYNRWVHRFSTINTKNKKISHLSIVHPFHYTGMWFKGFKSLSVFSYMHVTMILLQVFTCMDTTAAVYCCTQADIKPPSGFHLTAVCVLILFPFECLWAV